MSYDELQAKADAARRDYERDKRVRSLLDKLNDLKGRAESRGRTEVAEGVEAAKQLVAEHLDIRL